MADSVLLLVYADGGGFGPRAEAFGSDGADVEAEELADGQAGEVEADGAVGDDGEGSPDDAIGVGEASDELVFVEAGIVDAAPAGLHTAFEEGVFLCDDLLLFLFGQGVDPLPMLTCLGALRL